MDPLTRRIHRLVDNELPEDQLASLLSDLEARDSWRACALAFVESREWSSSMVDVPSSADAITPRTRDASSDIAASSHVSFGQLGWLAASLLLAFVLGFQVADRRDARSLTDNEGPRSTPPSTPESPSPSGDSDDPMTRGKSELVHGTGEGPDFHHDRLEEGRRLGEVTVEWNGPNSLNNMTLPVYASTESQQKQVLKSSIPDALIRRLDAAGIDVRSNVIFEEVPVGEAGVIFIPVEEVELVRRGQTFIP